MRFHALLTATAAAFLAGCGTKPEDSTADRWMPDAPGMKEALEVTAALPKEMREAIEAELEKASKEAGAAPAETRQARRERQAAERAERPFPEGTLLEVKARLSQGPDRLSTQKVKSAIDFSVAKPMTDTGDPAAFVQKVEAAAKDAGFASSAEAMTIINDIARARSLIQTLQQVETRRAAYTGAHATALDVVLQVGAGLTENDLRLVYEHRVAIAEALQQR